MMALDGMKQDKLPSTLYALIPSKHNAAGGAIVLLTVRRGSANAAPSSHQHMAVTLELASRRDVGMGFSLSLGPHIETLHTVLHSNGKLPLAGSDCSPG